MMPVIFREKEQKVKAEWLPKYYEERLENIRRLVKHLHMSKENIQQIKWFTPHGDSHCQAVEDLIHQLIPGNRHTFLTEDEKFFLLASAWLHDIGMIRGIMGDELESIKDEQIREEHHRRSEQFIIRNYRQVGIEEPEKEAFGMLARFHRRRCPLNDCPEELNIPNHNSIRLRLLAAYLRFADALHIDQTRAPDAQYAISLAYDIPNKAKLHWLRSKFVIGLDINAKKKAIAVHLKYPINDENTDEHKRKAMDRTLNSIYDLIVQDLSAELDTVKDVLFDVNISYFLRITKIVHKVEFDLQLLRDIRSVFNYYFLLDNPSSSSLYALMLQSIKEIIESYGLNSNENRDDIEQSALNTVSSFLDEIEERVLGSRKCHTGLSNFVNKIRQKVTDGGIRDLKDEIDFRTWLLERKRTGVRFSAYRYFHSKLKECFWKNKKGGLPPLNTSGEDTSIAENDESVSPFNILLYGYSELVVKSLCGFRDAVISRLIGKYYEAINNIGDASEDIYPWANRLNVQDTEVQEETEMKNAFESIKNLPEKTAASGVTPESLGGKKRLPLLHKENLEKKASDYFNIFVCEGQPKNRTTWGGRTIYHDGSRFAITLASHGFTNIFIIPDAVASSLVIPSFDSAAFPKIQFVMVGANGYDREKFLHSAGHAMVAAIATFAKTLSPSNESSGREIQLPTLILSIITDKYKSKNKEETSREESNQTPNDGKNPEKKSTLCKTIMTDGWKFRTAFADEPVRTQVFISQDQELRNSLKNEAPTALFYNPREDRIPISWVDVVITEKAWLEKTQEGKEWNGNYITIQNKDSSKRRET